MKYVEQASTGKPVSRIGLGTWQFGSREWGYGDVYSAQDAARIVARAVDLGITVFDTAEAYGFGRSERILGEALAACGAIEVSFVATKLFPVFPIAQVVARRGRASAARLRVSSIDLYQVHQPNPIIRDGTTMAGMRMLQDAGTVTHVGVSNYSLSRWQQAERDLGRPVMSNQVQFSLAHASPLEDLVPYASANGRLVIAWSPLAQGLLSGRYDATRQPSGAVRRVNPLFLDENLQRAAGLLDALRDIAAAHDAAPAQVALAWLVHQPGVIAIPGASSIEQVEMNAEAADLRLTDGQVADLTTQAQGFKPISPLQAGRALLRRTLSR